MPATDCPAGHAISFRLLASTRVPSGIADAATTTCWVSTGLAVLAFWNCLYTKVLSTNATTSAIASPTIMRFWFIKSVSSPQDSNRTIKTQKTRSHLDRAAASQSPSGRAIAGNRGQRNRHAERQLQQLGIVERDFRVCF